MMKRLPVLALAATLLAAGCQTHSAPPHSGTSVVTVVSTSSPDPSTDPASREVLQRFTNDIWPATVAYSGEGPSQGGPGNTAWAAITDKSLNGDAWNALRDAVHRLGVVSNGDDGHGPVAASDPLHAADTRVTALTPPAATVRVCYTFTAVSYPTDAAHPLYSPAASEADFQLHKTDNWYLHGITNNHVVPGCGASNS